MESTKFTTTIFAILLIGSVSIYSQSLNFRNIEVEFENQPVQNGILHKFEELFEDASDEDSVIDSKLDNGLKALNSITPETELDFNQIKEDFEITENYDEEFTDDYYEEASLDGNEDGQEEINVIAYNSLNKKNNITEGTDLNETYRDFVLKLCLLTAVSKETTIYARELVTV
jgi:hypothetical protein